MRITIYDIIAGKDADKRRGEFSQREQKGKLVYEKEREKTPYKSVLIE